MATIRLSASVRQKREKEVEAIKDAQMMEMVRVAAVTPSKNNHSSQGSPRVVKNIRGAGACSFVPRSTKRNFYHQPDLLVPV